MEADNTDPVEINSVDINKILHTSSAYVNKKRKFQAEQLGLPLSKHKCCGQSFTSECDSPSNKIPEAADFYTYIINEDIDGGAKGDESDPDSAKGSNSFPGDADSVRFLSGDAKTDLQYPKMCSYDQPSTSSVNWGGNYFKNTLYSLDSRSLTKSSADREKSPYIDDSGFRTSLNYKDHLLEYGSHVDCSSSEDRNYNIEQCTDKELEDMLNSNGLNPNSYVLSSGRWSVSQETQPGAKKLTIDKEFEQYFSMLML